MDSTWIASWLAYVHFDKRFAPAPGPCNNKRLITYDYQEKKYVGRTGLIMARNDFGGDYRRVSKEVWELFKEYYPESGPAITMTFELKEKNEKGFYDTSKWNILDFVEPPPDQNGKKKKKLVNIALPISLKSNKKAGGSQPVEDPDAKDSTNLLTSTSTTADAPNSNTIGSALQGQDGEYMVDSDDDIDIVQQNSFSGKTRNDPKVVRLNNVSYSKVGEEKKEAPSTSKDIQRDSVIILHSFISFLNSLPLFRSTWRTYTSAKTNRRYFSHIYIIHSLSLLK
jgi:hypothetical protein